MFTRFEKNILHFWFWVPLKSIIFNGTQSNKIGKEHILASTLSPAFEKNWWGSNSNERERERNRQIER
jgi:chaperone required for assembly of F1-ATPase